MGIYLKKSNKKVVFLKGQGIRLFYVLILIIYGTWNLLGEI